MGLYRTTGLLEASAEGAAPLRLGVFNIACWHRGCGSSQSQPASKLHFVLVRAAGARVYVCAWSSAVVMEEVCCRFARCRRRTSSLTLPRVRLVRPETWRFGFLLEHLEHVHQHAHEVEMSWPLAQD